jgi:predicted phosphodiesterase
MKIAALADIHGNLRALNAVQEDLQAWKPDLVYILGDTINRGPKSPDCLQIIQTQDLQAGWQVIKGNHEEYVLNFTHPDTPLSGPEYEVLQIVHWTFTRLTENQIAYNLALPLEINQKPDGKHALRAVHASMQGIRAGIYPSMNPEQISEMIQPAPDLILVGHTHQPLVKKVDQTLVVNSGSVGMPFDGDHRTGYARIKIQQGEIQAEIIRLQYDLEAAIDDFFESGFMDQGGPMARVVLTELELARPQLSHWNHTYHQPVIRKEISLQDAVNDFLQNPNQTLAW